MSNILFKLNDNPELLHKTALASVVNNVSQEESMAPLPEPIERQMINICKNFKWTKTLRKEVDPTTIPGFYMKEYYVTQPAFVSNLRNIGDAIINAGTNLFNTSTSFANDQVRELMGNGEVYDEYIGDNVERATSVASGIGNFSTNLIDSISKKVGGGGSIGVGNKKYMKMYENIYGVLESGFRYKFPYFKNTFKSSNSSYNDVGGPSRPGSEDSGKAGKIAGKAYDMLSTISSIGSQFTMGFQMDFAKAYNYGTSGPSTTISLYLDNTFDSSIDGSRGPNPWQKNWELIFLLLYQNLPNRRNKVFFDPPVIYKCNIPGVLTYIYSYIKDINIECVGNRRVLPVFYGNGNETSDTLIPEAYNVTFTVESLLPESKNLFLSSLDSKIQTSIVD